MFCKSKLKKKKKRQNAKSNKAHCIIYFKRKSTSLCHPCTCKIHLFQLFCLQTPWVGAGLWTPHLTLWTVPFFVFNTTPFLTVFCFPTALTGKLGSRTLTTPATTFTNIHYSEMTFCITMSFI